MWLKTFRQRRQDWFPGASRKAEQEQDRLEVEGVLLIYFCFVLLAFISIMSHSCGLGLRVIIGAIKLGVVCNAVVFAIKSRDVTANVHPLSVEQWLPSIILTEPRQSSRPKWPVVRIYMSEQYYH